MLLISHWKWTSCLISVASELNQMFIWRVSFWRIIKNGFFWESTDGPPDFYPLLSLLCQRVPSEHSVCRVTRQLQSLSEYDSITSQTLPLKTNGLKATLSWAICAAWCIVISRTQTKQTQRWKLCRRIMVEPRWVGKSLDLYFLFTILKRPLSAINLTKSKW